MHIHFITSLERHGAEKQLLKKLKKDTSSVISIVSGDLEENLEKIVNYLFLGI